MKIVKKKFWEYKIQTKHVFLQIYWNKVSIIRFLGIIFQRKSLKSGKKTLPKYGLRGDLTIVELFAFVDALVCRYVVIAVDMP